MASSSAGGIFVTNWDFGDFSSLSTPSFADGATFRSALSTASSFKDT